MSFWKIWGGLRRRSQGTPQPMSGRRSYSDIDHRAWAIRITGGGADGNGVRLAYLIDLPPRKVPQLDKLSGHKVALFKTRAQARRGMRDLDGLVVGEKTTVIAVTPVFTEAGW